MWILGNRLPRIAGLDMIVTTVCIQFLVHAIAFHFRIGVSDAMTLSLTTPLWLWARAISFFLDPIVDFLGKSLSLRPPA